MNGWNSQKVAEASSLRTAAGSRFHFGPPHFAKVTPLDGVVAFTDGDLSLRAEGEAIFPGSGLLRRLRLLAMTPQHVIASRRRSNLSGFRDCFG